MSAGHLIFAQVTDFIHREQFNCCMEPRRMPRVSKGTTARDQFLAMAFALVTFRKSLQGIEACLKVYSYLYGMGVRGNINRINHAEVNESLDWGAC